MPKPYEVKIGTYSGTGAALSITTGFRPTLVLAYNQTDGDTIWGCIDGMTDATAFAITTATAQIASQGCTLASTGFSLGTDSTINESAKTYVYVAIGGN